MRKMHKLPDQPSRFVSQSLMEALRSRLSGIKGECEREATLKPGVGTR